VGTEIEQTRTLTHNTVVILAPTPEWRGAAARLRRMSAAEIAAHAARLIVEEGLEYGPAKRRAVADLGPRARRLVLPGNDLVEDEVRAYLSLFRADSQPAELLALRHLAARWMTRLAEFRPHLSGAVWRGTATRLNDVWLALFCDDPKSAEIWLLNTGVTYDSGEITGFHGRGVPVLSLADRVPGWPQPVGVHLAIYDHDDLRGALKPDRRGQTDRGDLGALQTRLLDPKHHE
jgi:hypothetical protein